MTGEARDTLDAIANVRARSTDWPDTTARRNTTPTTETAWAGLARMAAARRAAGVELSPDDLTALTKHPQP